MEKCIGNCSICKLDVDKMACCMVQNLRLNIEIKQMLKKLTNGRPDGFATLTPVTTSEEVGEAEPLASGTDRADLFPEK